MLIAKVYYRYWVWINLILIIIFVIIVSYMMQPDMLIEMDMVGKGRFTKNEEYSMRSIIHIFIEDHIDDLLKLEAQDRVTFVQDAIILENKFNKDYFQIRYMSAYIASLDKDLQEVINEKYQYGYFLFLN